MPMYFPDLKSVQKLVEAMQKNSGDKRYDGIYPKTDEELPLARKQLAYYLRMVWEDEVQALEVELGVSEKDYDEKINQGMLFRMLGYDSFGNRKAPWDL